MISIALSELIESKKGYAWIIAAICLTYLVIQWCYVSYAIFSMDDLWLAYHTNQYKTGVPYRDFPPYKTVLGYYIFLIPMSLSHGVLTPLLSAKAWVVLINTIFLGVTSLWMQKFFSKKAILTGLLFIISTPIFLLFSSEIRVDLLAYWLCLISVLFVFEKKYFLAGISIGLGFLICQKASMYIIATNCGLVGCWLIHERTWKMIKNIFSFNLGSFLMLFLYIIFWSYYSSLSIVLNSIFYEAYLLKSFDWYLQVRSFYWDFIISNTLELVMLWPLALIGFILLPAKNKLFITLYTSVILFFIITSKHPFNYSPLLGMPALFVLFSAFFSALYSYFYASMHVNTGIRNLYIWMVLLFVFSIVIAAFSRFINGLHYYDGSYQKSMIHLTANLLSDGSGYVAGSPLLLDAEQPVPGLKHLIGPSIDYMYQPSKKLYTVLTLGSLYLSPATTPEVIASIKKAPVKLYVNNNRFHYLPPELFSYLGTQYQHFWGSVYLYAPEIKAGHQTINIKFSGYYRVKAKTVVSLDNKKIAPNSKVYLSRQHYISDASSLYRLVLIPDHVKHLLEPRYKKDDWKKLL